MSRRRRRITVSLLGVAALVGGLLVAGTASAGATTFMVTSTADSGAGTLRQAFADASADTTGPHTIEINVTAPIVLTSGALTYSNLSDEPLTIHGNGATVEQTASNRVIFSLSTGPLTVDGLTITGGDTVSGGGGAIKWAGPVTLTSSTITGNRAESGGGVSADGAVTIMASTITDNHATAAGGGGIEALGVAGSVTVKGSTVSGNTTVAGGGGITSPGAVTVTKSTISGNQATAGGGGISALAPIALTNSTVSGNTSDLEGGGVAGTDVNLVYATVASNTAPTGANIEIISFDSLTSFGSVVALPQGGGEDCNFEPAPVTVSHGFNFADDASCGFTNTAQGDRQSAGDPGLGGLADNGGATETRLPQPGSPLLDVIPAASCRADSASGVTTDQRGVVRPQGSGCDIGAVEVAVAAPTPVTVTPSFTG